MMDIFASEYFNYIHVYGYLFTFFLRYGVPLGPSLFSVISTRENTKVRRRKHVTTKTKTRSRKRENTISCR